MLQTKIIMNPSILVWLYDGYRDARLGRNLLHLLLQKLLSFDRSFTKDNVEYFLYVSAENLMRFQKRRLSHR